jgi:predicted dehydrogenase/threonine dehydrogenase-like Zn-dependent dehydrogenase
MRQIIQNLKNGQTLLEEVPAPEVRRGNILIRTSCSLVSLGTERMLVEFGKSNLISKARQQPEKVKQVLDKIKSEGLIPTLETVFNKLEQPLPLGYCNVGKVIAIGEGVSGFKIGDRVISNGAHAEFVCIPKNLVAHIPDSVSDEEAVFTVIGSIGLQGIRLLNPTLGEVVVVIGLGLIGLITAELLKANGCRVIGFDFDEQKVKIAKDKGIEAVSVKEGINPVKYVENLTNGIGADGVIITASAKTDEIISQAAQMSRKRGRIVLVGVIGLNISRAEFYEKELTFQVSCSYGAGRYDENYEQQGNDYPLPFVRWTENRNFQTILFSIEKGLIDVKPLITERIPLEDYQKIYGNMSNSRSIASILIYPQEAPYSNKVQVVTKNHVTSKGGTGIIGAGNFTKMTVLPNIKEGNLHFRYIASASGVSGTALAKKYKIEFSTTDYKEILKDDSVDLVMITTRHNQHASMVIESLNANKNVFVEKPLALNSEELEGIITAYNKTNKTVTVGFNRRFSPHIQKAKSLVGNAQMNIIATMNAGFIPAESWVHDLKVGGGRIIGEACHLIDLITFLTGSKVVAVCMNALGQHPSLNTDNATILLKYENGSTGIINYFSNGSKAYSKERIEVFSQEKTIIVDNFIKTEGFGTKGFSSLKTSLDKGHKKQFELLGERIKAGGEALIPFDEIVNTTKASFAAIESLKQNKWIDIV